MCRRTVSVICSLLLLVVAGLGFAAQEEPATDPGVSARLATARDAFKAIEQMRRAGEHLDPTKHYVWSCRLMEAEREAAGTKAERVAAAKAHVDRMCKLMKDCQVRWEHAEVSRLEFLDSQFRYSEAVSWWEKEKSK
jgi:hypothetical protein